MTEPGGGRPRVVHLSTYDEQGGAARCATRLHVGLKRIGVDSRMLVARRTGSDPDVAEAKRPEGRLARLRFRLRQKRIRRAYARYRGSAPADAGVFSDDRTPWAGLLANQLPSCGVVNLHWIRGFVDPRAFFADLPADLPVVWTLHDMNAFTGGCHYAAGCRRFTASCGACPQLGSSDPSDLSREVWERKRRALGSLGPGRPHVVTPSRWLAEQAARSSLFGDLPVDVIPYGVDTDVFTPHARSAAREALGIGDAERVLLFVSEKSANVRKGYSLLRGALGRLAHVPDLLLLSVGEGEPGAPRGARHLHLGTIASDRLLALVYNAADLFVIPSREDNLPATVLESLACGTPVVGFDVGGIPEAVRPGRTGRIVTERTDEALAAALRALLEERERLAEMRSACRETAEREYSLEGQASRYRDLYERTRSGGSRSGLRDGA